MLKRFSIFALILFAIILVFNSLQNQRVTQNIHINESNDIQSSTECNQSNQISGDAIISRKEAQKIVERFCQGSDGNNGTVISYQENDRVKDKKIYYYFEATYASGLAGMFYVDSTNGYIYSALDEDSFDKTEPLFKP